MHFRRHIDGLPWLTFGFYREQDDAGGGGGGTGDGGGAGDPGQGGSGGGTGDGGGTGGQGGGSSSQKEEPPADPKLEKKFSQAELDQHIKNRLDEEKKRREREAAVKNGEFEKALKDLQGEVEKDYKPKVEAYDKLAAQTNANITSAIKDWPKEVKDTDPGEDNVLARSEWFQKFGPLAQKLKGGGGGGNPPPPKGVNGDQGGGGKPNDPVKTFLESEYALPSERK